MCVHSEQWPMQQAYVEQLLQSESIVSVSVFVCWSVCLRWASEQIKSESHSAQISQSMLSSAEYRPLILAVDGCGSVKVSKFVRRKSVPAQKCVKVCVCVCCGYVRASVRGCACLRGHGRACLRACGSDSSSSTINCTLEEDQPCTCTIPILSLMSFTRTNTSCCSEVVRFWHPGLSSEEKCLNFRRSSVLQYHGLMTVLAQRCRSDGSLVK